MSLNTTVTKSEATAQATLNGDGGTFLTDHFISMEDQWCGRSLDMVPVVLTRGQGHYVWDVEGTRYIDWLGAFSVVNQGHCHPRITQAMIKQCQTLTLASRAYHNDKYPQLAKKLCEMLGFDKAFAMNSGSEVVDLAIKVSRKWGYNVKGIEPEQALYVTVCQNFHGKTMGPLSASDDKSVRQGYGPFMPNVGPIVNGRHIRFNNIEDLEYAFATEGHRIAAVMMEPVQGFAGCIVPEDGYLKIVSELCKKHNALFIVDEIQTGFGRTGYFMAYQKEGFQPDMVLVGKALTGGMYSMGMILGREEIMDQLGSGENSSTYAGNPLACAVAIESIDVVVDEKLAERSNRLGEELLKRLNHIESACPTSATGRGLFAAFHITENHPRGRVTASRLAALMRKRGVLVYSVSNRLRLAPPLNIDEDVLWESVDILQKSIKDIEVMEQI